MLLELFLSLGAGQDAAAAPVEDAWVMVQWQLPMPGPQRGSDMWYRRPVMIVSEDGPILRVEGLTPMEYGPDGAVTRSVGFVNEIDCANRNLRGAPENGAEPEAWGPPPPEFSPPYVFIVAVCEHRRPYATAPDAAAALIQSGEFERQWRERLEIERRRQ